MLNNLIHAKELNKFILPRYIYNSFYIKMWLQYLKATNHKLFKTHYILS